MTPYVQQSPRDCGFRALVSISGKTPKEVGEAMENREYNDWRDDVEDWPPLLKKAIKRLKLAYWEPSLDDILAGNCVPEKTMILVHSNTAPILRQHFVVLHSVTTTHVFCYWGQTIGDIRGHTHEAFGDLWGKGAPNWAVEIGRGNGRLRWWEKAIVGIGRTLIKIRGWFG